MPDHIRFMLRHALVGFLVALGFTGMILWFDVAGIRHLVTHTAEGPLALGVFVALCTITFGSVQIGLRIMAMNDDDDDDRGQQDEALDAAPIPIRVDDRR